MEQKLYTVQSLINFLKSQNRDAIIFVASDSEQNQVSPLLDATLGTMGKDIVYDGKVICKEGDDFYGIDFEKLKDKPYIVFNPTL